MKTMRRFALFAALTLIVAACGGADEAADTTVADTPTETTMTESTMTESTMTETTMTETTMTETTGAGSEVGTADNPIQVLFVPSAQADEILAGGEILDATLEGATGLTIEVSVPTSYRAVVEELCAAPDRTIGFIPATAYVLASNQCGADVALLSERFGSAVYWSQFIVARDSEFQTLSDLNGATWAFPDGGSTSGFVIPTGEYALAGVEIGEEVEAGGHPQVVQAVYDGTADVGTTYFTPGSNAAGDTLDWTPENADVPEDLIDLCAPNADGDLACGDDYFVNDARAAIAESAGDVVQNVRILKTTDPIPNDGVVFSPDFPEELRTAIVDAMLAYAESDPDGFQTAFDSYSWDSIVPGSDSDYDSIRAIVQELGLGLEDL